MKKLYVEELVVLAVLGDVKAQYQLGDLNTSWDDKETFKWYSLTTVLLKYAHSSEQD